MTAHTTPVDRLRDAVISTGRVRDAGDDPRRIRRLHAAGLLTRIRRGHYVDTQFWAARDERERHLIRMIAAQRDAIAPLVFCGRSAAAVWDVPVLGAWPDEVMVAGPFHPGGRSEPGVGRTVVGVHTLIPTERHGFSVTGVARTAIDLARSLGFADGVAAIDWARWRRNPERVPQDDLVTELERAAFRVGAAHVRRCIAFSSDLAHPPAESILRAAIHELGFPPPVLQLELSDAEGRMYADFAWPEQRLLVEFDGRIKYTDDRFTGGDPIAVFRAEKLRHRRLELLGWRVIRLEWVDVVDRQRLGSMLRRAGLSARG